jgi:hypothetical protein
MNRLVHWRGGIYTPTELHRSARRLDRRLASVDQVLTAMRRGESLHLQYENGRPLWSLSGGRTVSAETAEVLICNASVVPVGDALFNDMPGQTWRYVQ